MVENYLISIVLGAATILGVFIFLNLFFLKKGNTRANKILALLIFCFSCITFQNAIGFSGYYKIWPHMVFPFYPVNGLIYPLIYFYVLLQLNPKRKILVLDGIHTFYFLFLVYNHLDYWLLPTEFKINYGNLIYQNSENFVSLKSITNRMPFFLYNIGYLTATLLLIRKKKNTLQKFLSTSKKNYLNWLRNFTWLFLLIMALSLIMRYYCAVQHLEVRNFETYVITIKAITILTIGFLMFQHSERFSYILKLPEHQKTNLEKDNLINQVLEHLKLEKPYLNPKLKIHDLAKTLSIPTYLLSSLLNEELGLSFYDFINQYRVAEFKKRVSEKENERLYLMGIAYESGFNSKASFNRIFKKQTGKTPTQYIQEKTSQFII